MPKLYMSDVSPPVRSVLLTAKALNVNLEKIYLDVSNKKEQLTPEFIKLNPQHTIPTLVDDDGFAIWDSHVIMTYLVGKYGKTDELYPKDLKKRASVDQRMYFETEKAFGAIHKIFALMKQTKSEKPTSESIEIANTIYDFLNNFIGRNNYVAGTNLTIADFSLITSVQFLNILIPVDKKYENLHRWFKTMEKLPYYDVVTEGVDLGKNFLKTFMKP